MKVLGWRPEAQFQQRMRGKGAAVRTGQDERAVREAYELGRRAAQFSTVIPSERGGDE